MDYSIQIKKVCMFTSKKTQYCAAILACAVSVPATGFDLGGLKALGEKLQKGLEQQQGDNSNDVPKASESRAVVTPDKNRGSLKTICEDPKQGFGFGDLVADRYSVSDPEALVKRYFNIDSTIAEQQIREHLFSSPHPVIGAPFVTAIQDGGILSNARSRGIQLVKDPSITNLAQIIAAAEQSGGSGGGFGGGSSKLANIEANVIAAMVALELEPLLKNPSVVPALLKKGRKKGEFAGVSASGGKVVTLSSPMAFALSARYALFIESNVGKFDNFLTTSGERVTFEGNADSASLKDARGCQICVYTRDHAADKGLAGGKYAQQRLQGEQILADMNQNKATFNPPGWEQGFQKAKIEAERLNQLVRDIFQLAKTQSRSQVAGSEAQRRSAEAKEKYGMQVNEAVAAATELLLTDVPRLADENKKAALKKGMEDSQKNLDRLRKLQYPVMSAMMSMDYDVRDIREKSDRVFNLTMASCLVAVAEKRAAAASDVSLPDPEDNQAEEDFMRM